MMVSGRLMNSLSLDIDPDVEPPQVAIAATTGMLAARAKWF
jgi:hypothetical protein